MKHLKKFLWMMIAGGLLGALLFAWFSPHLIVWYFSPPSDLSISCKPAVEWAIITYRKIMFTGVLIGAITGGIFFFAFRRSSASGSLTAQGVPPSAQDGPK
jgi:hypothetical protein